MTASRHGLSEAIGVWLSAQIETGVKPADLLITFCREMGAGVKMFSSVSARPGAEDACVVGVCRGILREARRSEIVIEAATEH